MFLFCPMKFATDAIYSVKLKCAPTPPFRQESILEPSRATATTPRRTLLKIVPSPMEMSRTRVKVAETPHKRNPMNKRSEDSRREVGVLDMVFLLWMLGYP